MKSRMALLTMLVVAAAPLAAQQGGMQRGGGNNIEALTTLYSLTPEQKTKAEAALKVYTDASTPLRTYMMAQRQAQAEVHADSMKKSQELTAKWNEAFKAILTGDQVKKFDSVQAARANRQRPGGI